MVAEKPTLILGRFDRNGHSRIPFLSARSMLGAIDREQHSYMEIADAIRRYGATPSSDLRTSNKTTSRGVILVPWFVPFTGLTIGNSDSYYT